MVTAPPRVQVRAAVSLRQAASFLLADLESHRLTVSLAAAPDRRHSGHKIRCVEQRNPAWYRQLCAEYITRRSRPRNRKPKYGATGAAPPRGGAPGWPPHPTKFPPGGGGVSLYSQRVLPYVSRCQPWLSD